MERPIFIVGASRSGTALLRAILNNHPEIHLSGETHYLDDLRARLRGASPGSEPLHPEDAARCERYFLALAHRPYGHQGTPERSRMNADELRFRAHQIGDGADAWFEAYCRLNAEQHGKPRWGEKTPRHVFRLNEILAAYPGAQVIFMVRDPRAVVASYRDWRNQGGFPLENDPDQLKALERDHERAARSYNIIIASLLWRAAVRAAVDARERFGPERICIQKYEDLASEPEPSVRELARRLGVEFDPAMLDVPMLNSSFSKFQRQGGVSREPVERWKTKLSATEIATIQTTCGAALAQAGYERLPVGVHAVAQAAQWAALPVAVVRAAAANRDRIGNLPAYVWRRCSLALGGRRATGRGPVQLAGGEGESPRVAAR